MTENVSLRGVSGRNSSLYLAIDLIIDVKLKVLF